MQSADKSASVRPDADAPEILLVISSLDIGGTERHLVEIASALHRRGRRITVYALAGGALAKTLEANGVPLNLAPTSVGSGGFSFRKIAGLVATAGHLLWTLLTRRPHVVHFFLPEAYLVGGCLAVLARTPLRVMSRRSLNDYQRGYPTFVVSTERSLHRTMTAVLGNSRSVVHQLRDEEGVATDRLGLIYNGIDPAPFAAGAARVSKRNIMRDQLGLRGSSLVIVMVANIIPYKGHADLLTALAGISARLPKDWCLLLLGRDGGAETDLRVQARDQSMAGNVRFLNARTDVPDVLAAADIGILCSHQEGFANAVLEGMAAGLPMVVTDVGGNPEAVIDGETGYVVPPRDPARLGDAILRLALDGDLRSMLGAAARTRAVEKFSLAQCIDCYEQFYSSLLAGRGLQEAPLVRVG
jgi:glycosyltransferase involved in cell wall biosynthesis